MDKLLNLYKKYDLNTPPIDIIQICKGEGIEVMIASNIDEDLDFNSALLLNPELENNYRIMVSPKLEVVEQIYEIAVLFSRYFLTISNKDRVTEYVRDSNSSKNEFDMMTETFASQLLIPESILRIAVNKYSSNIVISGIFQVPVPVLIKRRFELGI